MVDLGATRQPFRRYFEAGTKSHQQLRQNGGCEAPLGLPWQAFAFTLLAQLSLGRLCLRFLPSLRLLYAEKLYFRISTPPPHGMLFFEGPGTQVGATWAEKSSPTGPACARSGKSERSGQSSFTGRCGLAVKVMDRTGTQARPASSLRAKSIKATRHMIRSSISADPSSLEEGATRLRGWETNCV